REGESGVADPHQLTRNVVSARDEGQEHCPEQHQSHGGGDHPEKSSRDPALHGRTGHVRGGVFGLCAHRHTPARTKVSQEIVPRSTTNAVSVTAIAQRTSRNLGARAGPMRSVTSRGRPPTMTAAVALPSKGRGGLEPRAGRRNASGKLAAGPYAPSLAGPMKQITTGQSAAAAIPMPRR